MERTLVPVAFLALRTSRNTPCASGRFVFTLTCTGSGSRHARTDGQDTISTLSTVVGAVVGKAVGVAVGDVVGALVGTADGDVVGVFVGAWEGANVGAFVGNSVGASVGDLVGMSKFLVMVETLLDHPDGFALLSNT
jgi:hypothetical protein